MKARRRATIAALAAAVAAAIWLGAAANGDRPGRLVAGDDVPDDLRLLATGTFIAFEERFPERMDCMSDVRLVPVWEGLEDRARYLPADAVIELRVPATANLLADSLVHELAHHLEFTCADHLDFRPTFLEAQGRPSGDAWDAGPTWAETPSEQFAEAVVTVVLGRRQQHRLEMQLTEEAVSAVAAWGRGG